MASTTPAPFPDQEPAPLPSIQATFPPRTALTGRYVHLRPLEPTDASALYTHLGGPDHARLWTFLPDGPYLDHASFAASIARKSQSTDPLFFCVLDAASGAPVGHVSFLRVDVPNRVVELGHLVYGAAVQRSRVTTEIIYLMMRLVFDRLDFRRCEWKCDDRNAPSKKAAGRFGFTFEGLFRQHLIVKGRNRDTAWFSVVDWEWERVKKGFEGWLDPENFDGEGRQRKRLEEFRE